MKLALSDLLSHMASGGTFANPPVKTKDTNSCIRDRSFCLVSEVFGFKRPEDGVECWPEDLIVRRNRRIDSRLRFST